MTTTSHAALKPQMVEKFAIGNLNWPNQCVLNLEFLSFLSEV